jgi:2'-5' RNA ligase
MSITTNFPSNVAQPIAGQTHPKLVLLSGKPTRADIISGPVGYYDGIREDVRKLSTVQPVDRIFIERSEMGYRGVLFSNERPYLFAMTANGFAAKAVEDSAEVAALCTQFEGSEQRLTARKTAEVAEQEQEAFNADVGAPIDNMPYPAQVSPGVGPLDIFHGPSVDTVERTPFNFFKKGAAVKGTMVAFFVPEHVGERIVLKDGEHLKDLHVTLAYLGKGLTPEQKRAVQQVVRELAPEQPQVYAKVAGLGRFSASETSDGKDVIYASVDSTHLMHFREKLVRALKVAGLPVNEKHSFTPHITLAYVEPDAESPIKRVELTDMMFTHVAIATGEERKEIVLKKPPKLEIKKPAKRLAKAVKRPGSRGGKGYFDKEGQWQYGQQAQATYKLGDLPRDMREEMFNLHATGVNPDATERAFASKQVPHGMLDVEGLQVENVPEAQLKRYVDADVSKMPPIVIADGRLVDGNHRVAAARARGIKQLSYIDLTGIIDTDESGFISELKKSERRVKQPGKRGAKFWIDEHGQVRYDERPQPQQVAPAMDEVEAPRETAAELKARLRAKAAEKNADKKLTVKIGEKVRVTARNTMGVEFRRNVSRLKADSEKVVPAPIPKHLRSHKFNGEVGTRFSDQFGPDQETLRSLHGFPKPHACGLTEAEANYFFNELKKAKDETMDEFIDRVLEPVWDTEKEPYTPEAGRAYMAKLLGYFEEDEAIASGWRDVLHNRQVDWKGMEKHFLAIDSDSKKGLAAQKFVREQLRAITEHYGATSKDHERSAAAVERANRYSGASRFAEEAKKFAEQEPKNRIRIDGTLGRSLAASAYHGWDGFVAVQDMTWKAAARFIKKMAAKGSNTTFGFYEAMAFRTLIHEEFHGASSMEMNAYVGVGNFIEEVATEVCARHAMLDKFGTLRVGASYYKEGEPNFAAKARQLKETPEFQVSATFQSGSYGDYINTTFTAICEALAPSPHGSYSRDVSDKAGKILVGAALAVKQPDVPASKNGPEHLAMFISKLDLDDKQRASVSRAITAFCEAHPKLKVGTLFEKALGDEQRSIFGLQRNDVKGAIALRAAGIAAGSWTPDDDHMLLLLQDDPSKLLAALDDAKKALPRLSDDERAEREKSTKPVAGKASSMKVGAGGRVRYDYPGEKGGEKKDGGKSQPKLTVKPGAKGKPGAQQQQGEEDDTPDEAKIMAQDPPPPNVDPVVVPRPGHEQAPADDPRHSPQHHAKQPNHTVNVGELCLAMGTTRAVLDGVAKRFQAMPHGRVEFVKFMQQHAAEFAQEKGLKADYFGMVYDVLTGAIPEGQPSKDVQPPEQGAQSKPVGKTTTPVR